MPLARGSAAVGYMTLLAIFMAADMPINARIPTVDFSLLSFHPLPCVCASTVVTAVELGIWQPWLRPMLHLVNFQYSLLFSGADECVLVQSYQPDWEAILSRSPQDFIASVSKWLYPAAAHALTVVSSGDTGPSALPLDELPVVGDILGTLRARLEALNGPEAPQIHTL